MCVLQLPVIMLMTLTNVWIMEGSVMRQLADVPVSRDNHSVGNLLIDDFFVILYTVV